MKRKTLLFAAFMISTILTFAQVAINPDGSAPDNSAGLDVKFTNKGFLPPRLTTAQRNSIESPVAGLIIFNTEVKRLEYYAGVVTGWTTGQDLSTDWSLAGNAGTLDGNDFIGTTDNVSLNFRVNNEKAGRIDPLLFNTFLGYQAGNANTTGGSNIANGYQALLYNINGSDNTAGGFMALQNNVSGSNGTAFGNSAMKYSNNSATPFTNYNVAVGFEALMGSMDASANTGNSNTALGYQTLWSNTSGNNNTANGRLSLFSNTTGNQNTAVGSVALYNNTLGINNTATGYVAMQYNTSGSENTATGVAALYYNQIGNWNGKLTCWLIDNNHVLCLM